MLLILLRTHFKRNKKSDWELYISSCGKFNKFMNKFISFFSHAVNEEINIVYCCVKNDMRFIKSSPVIN